MKRKILWGAMASFISFMIIAIALMTAMFIRMVQMTVPESSSVSPSGPYYDGLYIDLVQEADYQNYLDNQWTARLRASAKVEINQEVLKTVNNH